jgi:hypothetical protein
VITIVSGLPRSGTSLMMQMLGAGGITVLSDSERRPDVDNPLGYYEWEPIKMLPKQPDLIDQANGKVVKVISQLLLSIPEGRNFKIIFMQRRLPEVLASQEAMLQRRGAPDWRSAETMSAAFAEHLSDVSAWLNSRPDVSSHFVGYRELLEDPIGISRAIQDFLALNLNVTAMAQQVNLALYRNRFQS